MSQAPKIISPTIGRCLWYWPSAYDRGLLTTKPETIIEANTTQACDAHVVCVHGDRLINIALFDHNGKHHRRTSVTLVQPGDMPPAQGGFCSWMDYQVNQAQAEAATGKVEVVLTVDDPVQAKDLEAAIVAGVLGVATRITLADVEASIVSESYFTAADGLIGASSGKPGADLLPEYVTFPGGPLSQVTFCVLVLENSTKLVGINYGSIDPKDHDAPRGRLLARAAAIEQIWPLLGFELRSKLKAQKQATPATGISPNATLHTEDPDHAEA